MKAAFISDLHIGPTAFYKGVRRKLTEHAENYVHRFVEQVSDSNQYSFAIQLGDLIQDEGLESDRENVRNALSVFAQTTIPFHHVVGNHDTINISHKEIGDLLSMERLYYSFDIDGVHVVILHSFNPVPETPGIIIPSEQMEWLKADLNETDKPTLIFIHHSLADQDLAGNPWFAGRSELALIDNRADVRDLISASGKVVAVVNGHLHWNQVEVHDGIPYITVQSAIENFADDGIPANSWGEVEVSEQQFRLSVFGNDPYEFEYQFTV
jgi:Icc protein